MEYPNPLGAVYSNPLTLALLVGDESPLETKPYTPFHPHPRGSIHLPPFLRLLVPQQMLLSLSLSLIYYYIYIYIGWNALIGITWTSSHQALNTNKDVQKILINIWPWGFESRHPENIVKYVAAAVAVASTAEATKAAKKTQKKAIKNIFLLIKCSED